MYYNIEYPNHTEVYEYLRKSRSDDPALSVEEVLEKHEKILNEFAERNLGGIVPSGNTFREIASSETIDGRPEMLRLLKGIESPRIKAVLVVEVQRLSRGDLEDAGRLIKLLRYTNTMVITPQRIYNLHDEYDRDAFERELKRGNEYLEYFKKIQARGRLASVQDGNFVGSIPPYGYDKIFVTVGKKKCPTLQENKEQADVVRMIFDMYVNQDMGRTRICNRLEELHIKPPKGEYWSPAALKDMLQNVHYIGKVKWNWRKTVKVVENQEVIKTRPKSVDYCIFEGKHNGIISEELFMAAQEKQGRNHRAKASTKIRNPLASILYCRCGRAMSYRTYKRPDGTIKSAPRLLCDNQTHCHTGSISYDEMIAKICEIMEDSIQDFRVLLNTDNSDSIRLHNNLIKNLEKKLSDLEEKELKQWEKYSEDGMPKAIFEKLNIAVLKEKEEVQQALIKAQESMPDPVDYQKRITRFSDALTALKNPDIPNELKNRYLKNIFEKIIYYREAPTRVTRLNCSDLGIKTEELRTGSNWHSIPIELDVIFKD